MHIVPSSISKRVRDMVGDSLGADIVQQNIEKAAQTVKDAAQDATSPVSMFWDPMSLFMGREWLVRRGVTALTARDLRRMAQNPIIASIIQTRLNQAAGFMIPSTGTHDQGFRIVSDDEEAKEDVEQTKAITAWLMNCGIEDRGENLLETLARKILRDSLVLDTMTAEVVMRRNGLPAYLLAVDGGTIRRLKRSLIKTEPPGEEPFYVQVVNEKIVAEYPFDRLVYGIRNPMTDIQTLGYGMSELEYLFRVITTIINADKFNASLLAQGGINKGILVVKKPPAGNEFEMFKRDFREAYRNAAQYWRPPVLGVPDGADVEWKRLDESQRDMEYAQLFDFLVKQACGVYQIDPVEVNWSIGASGQRTTFESRQNDKVMASQRKGLKPLLRFFANSLTSYVVQKLDDRFRMEFIGVAEDRKAQGEIMKMEVTSVRTLNEGRAELGLEPVPGGDIVLNAEYLKHISGSVDDEEMEGLFQEVEAEPGDDEERGDANEIAEGVAGDD